MSKIVGTVPKVRGVEVKVGQKWADHRGNVTTIKSIDCYGYFKDDLDFTYEPDGLIVGHNQDYSVTTLVKDVETTYGETPSLSDSCLTSIRKATVEPKASFTESEINAKISQVIKEFDWQRAASVYTALNWKWFTTQGIPTIGDLVLAGTDHMKHAVQIAVSNQDEGYVSSGGLIGRAHITTDGEIVVSLEMQVTEASSGY